MPKLTDLYIGRLPFSKERVTHWDTLLPAFGVRIGARSKTFIVIDSSGSRCKLGTYPHLRLAQAREQARKRMGNPEPTLPSFTLTEAATAYLEAIDVRPNTRRFYKLFLDKLKEKHGRLQLGQITPRMCAEATESPHMHLTLKVFFNWCKGQALITMSPMENLKPVGKFKTRSRVLTDDELKRVWIASGELGNFGIVVRLCILTGQRRGEISQVNAVQYSTELLIFSSSQTKNKREHLIPLTKSSLAQLKNLTGPCRAWSKPKKKLDELSGVTAWTLHDLRRTFATTLARLGIPPHVIERLLNHHSGVISGVAQIYNRHDFLPEMRAALELYEKHLETVLQKPLV